MKLVFALIVALCAVSAISADCGCTSCSRNLRVVPSRSNVQVIYKGQPCPCQRALPYQVEVPVEAAPQRRLSYGYQVIEGPRPAPPQPRYSYDYQLQIPVPKPPPFRLNNLVAKLDRVVLPAPDCRGVAPAIETESNAPCDSGLASYSGFNYLRGSSVSPSSSGTIYSNGVPSSGYVASINSFDNIGTLNTGSYSSIQSYNGADFDSNGQLAYSPCSGVRGPIIERYQSTSIERSSEEDYESNRYYSNSVELLNTDRFVEANGPYVPDSENLDSLTLKNSEYSILEEIPKTKRNTDSSNDGYDDSYEAEAYEENSEEYDPQISPVAFTQAYPQSQNFLSNIAQPVVIPSLADSSKDSSRESNENNDYYSQVNYDGISNTRTRSISGSDEDGSKSSDEYDYSNFNEAIDVDQTYMDAEDQEQGNVENLDMNLLYQLYNEYLEQSHPENQNRNKREALDDSLIDVDFVSKETETGKFNDILKDQVHVATTTERTLSEANFSLDQTDDSPPNKNVKRSTGPTTEFTTEENIETPITRGETSSISRTEFSTIPSVMKTSPKVSEMLDKKQLESVTKIFEKYNELKEQGNSDVTLEKFLTRYPNAIQFLKKPKTTTETNGNSKNRVTRQNPQYYPPASNNNIYVQPKSSYPYPRVATNSNPLLYELENENIQRPNPSQYSSYPSQYSPSFERTTEFFPPPRCSTIANLLKHPRYNSAEMSDSGIMQFLPEITPKRPAPVPLTSSINNNYLNQRIAQVNGYPLEEPVRQIRSEKLLNNDIKQASVSNSVYATFSSPQTSQMLFRDNQRIEPPMISENSEEYDAIAENNEDSTSLYKAIDVKQKLHEIRKQHTAADSELYKHYLQIPHEQPSSKYDKYFRIPQFERLSLDETVPMNDDLEVTKIETPEILISKPIVQDIYLSEFEGPKPVQPIFAAMPLNQEPNTIHHPVKRQNYPIFPPKVNQKSIDFINHYYQKPTIDFQYDHGLGDFQFSSGSSGVKCKREHDVQDDNLVDIESQSSLDVSGESNEADYDRYERTLGYILRKLKSGKLLNYIRRKYNSRLASKLGLIARDLDVDYEANIKFNSRHPKPAVEYIDSDIDYTNRYDARVYSNRYANNLRNRNIAYSKFKVVESSKPKLVYDRLGHKYVEVNGFRRLIKPNINIDSNIEITKTVQVNEPTPCDQSIEVIDNSQYYDNNLYHRQGCGQVFEKNLESDIVVETNDIINNEPIYKTETIEIIKPETHIHYPEQKIIIQKTGIEPIITQKSAEVIEVIKSAEVETPCQKAARQEILVTKEIPVEPKICPFALQRQKQSQSSSQEVNINIIQDNAVSSYERGQNINSIGSQITQSSSENQRSSSYEKSEYNKHVEIAHSRPQSIEIIRPVSQEIIRPILNEVVQSQVSSSQISSSQASSIEQINSVNYGAEETQYPCGRRGCSSCERGIPHGSQKPCDSSIPIIATPSISQQSNIEKHEEHHHSHHHHQTQSQGALNLIQPTILGQQTLDKNVILDYQKVAQLQQYLQLLQLLQNSPQTNLLLQALNTNQLSSPIQSVQNSNQIQTSTIVKPHHHRHHHRHKETNVVIPNSVQSESNFDLHKHNSRYNNKHSSKEVDVDLHAKNGPNYIDFHKHKLVDNQVQSSKESDLDIHSGQRYYSSKPYNSGNVRIQNAQIASGQVQPSTYFHLNAQNEIDNSLHKENHVNVQNQVQSSGPNYYRNYGNSAEQNSYLDKQNHLSNEVNIQSQSGPSYSINQPGVGISNYNSYPNSRQLNLQTGLQIDSNRHHLGRFGNYNSQIGYQKRDAEDTLESVEYSSEEEM